jgi:hypothetical protein
MILALLVPTPVRRRGLDIRSRRAAARRSSDVGTVFSFGYSRRSMGRQGGGKRDLISLSR